MTDTVKYLQGPRLYLRPIEPTDLERYYRWMNDPDVTRWILRNLPMPLGAERAFIERRTTERPDVDHVFAVVLHERNEHIGSVGVHGINWINRTGVTGWMIGAKQYWRQGYGREAVTLLLHYTFRYLNLRKVTSATIAPNTGSNRIHETCGYRAVGHWTHHCFRDGAYYDEMLWELFSTEFEHVWHTFTQQQVARV